MTLNGMKMLASGSAYAHEVLIGNVMPLAPDQKKEAITCVIPLNLPGLSLWSRQPFNRDGDRVFDAPLTHHFDESDCMLVFKDVKVPWEKVIVHDNAGAVAQHLCADALACDGEPSMQCAVRIEAALRHRRREPGHAGDRRARHPGGARDAGAAGRDGGRLSTP